MATIANWNGHTFEVSPKLIRSFTDLSIKGSCETTDKNSDKQKYVERKYGDIPQISMTIELNAQTGVTDVYGEAQEFVKEATDGAAAYFYMGSSKLIPAKMMLTEAEVTEIVIMPGQGDKWISCRVKVKFKQGSVSDGSSGGSSGDKTGKESDKATVKTYKLKDLMAGTAKLTEDIKANVTAGLNKLKDQLSQAKAASQSKNMGGIEFQNSIDPRKTAEKYLSSIKTNPTTGRNINCEITLNKITRIPSKTPLSLKLER